VHMNIGDNGEKLMVTIMQLLLLCIPVYNRIQLRYLLHFMNQWNLHHSLCVQTDVGILQILTVIFHLLPVCFSNHLQKHHMFKS
jgi:hypothetical protein